MSATAPGEPLRRGMWSPPAFDPSSARSILSEYRGREYVPLGEAANRVGWTPTAARYAARNGLLEAEQARGVHGRPYVITTDELAKLLFAAMLAVAAGVAIAVILRGVSGAGVTGAAARAALGSMPT